MADPRSLWWRHEQLHRRVLCDPAVLRPLFIAERDEIESAWLAQTPEPQAAFAAGDELLARSTEMVR